MRLVRYGVKPFAYWSIAVSDTTVTEEEGDADRPGKPRTKALATPDAARAFAAKQIAGKVAEGFVSDALDFERVLLDDVSDRLRVDVDDDDEVIVFSGSTRFPHSLWLDYREAICGFHDERTARGILVMGDLEIDGALVNWENDYGPFLQVEGDLRARAIATGGAEIHVAGNVAASEIVGVYNHGSVRAGGDVSARVIATEHTVQAKGTTNALVYEGGGRTIHAVVDGVADETNPYEAKGVFASGLVSDGIVDLRLARRWVADGKPIAKPVFASVRDEFARKFGPKLAAPEKVKSISLAGKDLRALPADLFSFQKLEKLDLTHNQLSSLPERLGELTELRELHLQGNGLLRLPESIGNLTKLQHLDLEANCIVGLPHSLAHCRQLRTVKLGCNPYSYVARAFGGWKNVELMWELPSALLELPNLETLLIEQTFLRRAPPGAFASTKLKPVVANRTLLTQDAAAHLPALLVDAGSAREHAVNYIRYWFNKDHVRLETFFDPKTKTHDFVDLHALLRLLIEINAPIAGPCDDALESFEKQTAGIVHFIDYSGKATEHVRALFRSFHDYLATLESDYPDCALVTGLRPIFAARMGPA